MKIIIHQFKTGPRNGERLPLATSLSGLGLDPYMSAWSMTRRTNLTPSSRENALYDLLPLRLWAEIASIPLEERMVYGQTLTLQEIRDLVYHLHIPTKDLRKLAHTTIRDTNKFYDSSKRISTQAFLRRTSTAWDYLEFLGHYGNRILRKTGKDNQTLMDVRQKKLATPIQSGNKKIYPQGSIAKELIGRRPRARQNRLSTHKTAELEDFALALVNIQRNEVWPSNKHKALRNEIILRLFVETGLRSGELRQIKIEDLRMRDYKIEIPRRHNDPESKGRREANAKTFDGTVPADPNTWSMIIDWLDIHADISDTVDNESPFLFINLDRNPQHKGQQISPTAIDTIVKDFCKHNNLPKLSAHPLRHLRARNLVDTIREKNLTHEQARKAITYLMRWSDDSDMLSHYLGDHADAGAENKMAELHSQRGFSEEGKSS
jgi:integrase